MDWARYACLVEMDVLTPTGSGQRISSQKTFLTNRRSTTIEQTTGRRISSGLFVQSRHQRITKRQNKLDDGRRRGNVLDTLRRI